jgi:hypothetical protein
VKGLHRIPVIRGRARKRARATPQVVASPGGGWPEELGEQTALVSVLDPIGLGDLVDNRWVIDQVKLHVGLDPVGPHARLVVLHGMAIPVRAIPGGRPDEEGVAYAHDPDGRPPPLGSVRPCGGDVQLLGSGYPLDLVTVPGHGKRPFLR